MAKPDHATRSGLRLGVKGYVSLLAAIFMLAAGLTSAAIGYYLVREESAAHIREKIGDLTDIIKSEIVYMVYQPVQPTLSAIARGVLPRCRTLEERLEFLPLLTNILENYGIMSGVFVGYEDGGYFMVRRLDMDEEKRLYDAPGQSAFMVSNIERDGNEFLHERLFYGADLQLLRRWPIELSPHFDPRDRTWFVAAMHTAEQVEALPYINAAGLPVMVFAEKSHDGRSVAGIDITLRQLTEILRRELPTPGAQLALLRPDGEFMAGSGGASSEDGGAIRLRTVEDLSPAMRLAAQAYMDGQRGRGITINDGQQDWEISLEEFDFGGKAIGAMILVIPRGDLMAGGMKFLNYIFLGLGGVLVLCVPLIWYATRRASLALRSLAVKADAMHEFVLDKPGAVQSGVSEIETLARSMQHLQGNIRKMLTITQAINSERDFDALLQRVLEETLSVIEVDGGVVAMLDEEKRVIFDQGAACWIIDGKKSTELFRNKRADIDISLASYQALAQNMVLRTSISREDSRSRMPQVAPGFADPAVSRLDAVCVPLRDRMGEHIGMLALFKAIRNEDGGGGFQFDEVGFIESFTAMVAIALENQRLMKGHTELRDALIHILAGAIDAKSPYTGGHCQRVPVIFQMLLEAACLEKDGPFKDFILDDNDWEAAKMAAWLHDCGKVTTPEYVVDKATKLETINDRIHEIRTRFEVLKRDAEIGSLRAVLAGAKPERAQQELEIELRSLDEDFAFVAACNLGGEYMDDEALKRLAAIGGRTWRRTLDKRLGVSRDERARMERIGITACPAWENLLMDNPEHIIPLGEKDVMGPHNPWGFKLAQPDVLYNRGELHNLSIRRGTLTAEERYKINDHIMRTIIMLEAIPLPKHLRLVPEIAGAHHETMDGKGYPRGLKREDMSWGARMMAVADIFEALTAWDRPYKFSKTLRETLEIMDKFKDDQHIDPDVYALFIKAGIPQKYAAEYLKPEQNDL